MSLHLPPRSFRDSYRWVDTPGPTEQQPASHLPFHRDGRVHPMRAAYEFYPTPPEATRALLSVESFDGTIWEPACGRGAISMVLEAAGHQVVSTDLIQRDYGIGGVDFLRQTEPRAKHIVTNPPYGRGLGDEFVRHALARTRETGGTVAMLLNLASLCHPKRHELWVSNPTRSTNLSAGRRAIPGRHEARPLIIATVGWCGSRTISASRVSGGSQRENSSGAIPLGFARGSLGLLASLSGCS
jgi:hypothetical protein